jgi:hypothetical protein
MNGGYALPSRHVHLHGSSNPWTDHRRSVSSLFERFVMNFLVTGLTRAGPFLGRLATRSPGLWAKFLASLKAGGGFVGDSVSSVVKFATSNKAAAIFTVSSLASLGVSVADLFSDNDVFSKAEGSGADAESIEFLRDANRLAMSPKDSAEVMNTLRKFGADSESFEVALDSQRTSIFAAGETLAWATNHFGSREAAIEAHTMLQAFVEMRLKDVQVGMETLNLSRFRRA